MFERFTRDARTVVHVAATGAQETGADVDSIALLLALSWLDSGPDSGDAAGVVRAAGLDRPALERAAASVRPSHGDDSAAVDRSAEVNPNPSPLDRESLAALGIDLDSVRGRVDDLFGPGALDVPVGGESSRGRRRRARFTPDAKKALELALREAVRLHDKELTSTHLLLGLLRDDDSPAHRVLVEAAIDIPALRASAERSLSSRAA